MSRAARVTSVESLQEFRNALCEFGQDARDTLCAADMHIRRTFDWLKERTKHWQREIRARQEEVVRAKGELLARKNAKREGWGSGTTDQEKALRKAQKRLKEAEDMLGGCRRWGPQLQHEVNEYQAMARKLSGALDTQMVHALATLAQKTAALESYLALTPSMRKPVAEGTGPPAEPPAVPPASAVTQSAEPEQPGGERIES